MDGKKIGVIALLIIAVAAVLWYRAGVYANRDTVGTKSGAGPRLVLVTAGEGPYWQAMADGAQQAAKDCNAEVTIMMPEGEENLSRQSDLLSGIETTEIDGIAVSPLDADKQSKLIDQISKHAFVITVDSDAPFSQRLNYVGASNRAAGHDIAELIKKAFPDGANIIVCMANKTKQNTTERKAGIEQGLFGRGGTAEGSKYKIIDTLVDEGDEVRCEEQLRKAIDAAKELNCIVGLNGYQGPIIAEVLEDKNLRGKVNVITFDVDPITLDAIASGTINAAIAQDSYQYGYEAINSLCSFCKREADQLPLPGVYATTTIGTKVVDKNNLGEFRGELGRQAEARDTPATSKTEPVKANDAAAATKKLSDDAESADADAEAKEIAGAAAK